MQFAYTAERLTERTEQKSFCSFTLSHRWPGGEGRVRGADEHVTPLPTSPSRRYATGPSLSP
jgi:hypothetical protein